jgi:predicted kinase
MKSFLDILEEEKSGDKHHVMAFGRMNPPTTGHLKLIHKIRDTAEKHNATHSVVVSHSQDSKKNPLSGQQKVKHLNRYSPGTHFQSSSKEHPTILHHAAELHKKGVTHLHVVAGSDRVKEMHTLLHKYNGHEAGHGKYHFKKITVHSAGHRDPDSEGSEGMSGTKMREHAKSKNFHEFRKGVPEHVSDKHAKELMHDTRKGMGLHEDVDRGMFKAIFVTGGPGSGKDVIIREAIAEGRITELNFVQATDYLGDKQKLSEQTKDFRREAIRNRGPLIINGPADNNEKVMQIKESLEEIGYETMMVFVDTSDEVSKERNSSLSRMMVESVRQDKWSKSQRNTKYFTEVFTKFVPFDNTGDIESKEEDIHDIYESTKDFLDSRISNEVAEDWLVRNHKSYVNFKLDTLFKEDTNVQVPNKFIQKIRTKGGSKTNGGSKRFLNDNNSPVQQLARKFGKQDDVRDGDLASNSGYTFRTYEGKEPTVKIQPQAKEPNFQKDKEKVISKKRWSNGASGAIRTSGVGPEYDTRQQGTVYPMSGMGDVTYKEQKEFSSFRKVKEAIDDPGANDMGVGGTLGGATNKEPLVTPADNQVRVNNLLKKKKK